MFHKTMNDSLFRKVF